MQLLEAGEDKVHRKNEINCQIEVIECFAEVNKIPPLQTGDAVI